MERPPDPLNGSQTAGPYSPQVTRHPWPGWTTRPGGLRNRHLGSWAGTSLVLRAQARSRNKPLIFRHGQRSPPDPTGPRHPFPRGYKSGRAHVQSAATSIISLFGQDTLSAREGAPFIGIGSQAKRLDGESQKASMAILDQSPCSSLAQGTGRPFERRQQPLTAGC